ncbi:MAG: phosphotransferase [Pseudomonadales bacterium]|nr:phosphotransferase [Pseudomonadales bacterium]MBO6658125.1 phosphotransferase [Pseudomonadales bacterium]
MASKLSENVIHYGGEEGERWLKQLPQRIEELSDSWQLKEVTPYKNLSFNYVAHALQSGEPVVLKIGWAQNAIVREREWLKYYEDKSELVINVLAQQGDDAYLMPRLSPGTTAETLSDEDSTELIGHCVKSLHGSETDEKQKTNYPNVLEWFSELQSAGNAARQVLSDRIDKAHAIAKELAEVNETRLLHGDLHHTNLLKDQSEWVITDPHGVLGDPAHECAAMLRNGLMFIDTTLSKATHRRVDQLANITGLDKKRICAWGYAQNILSCVWSLNANPKADVAAVIQVIDTLDIG